jgi:hypothetical protein
MKVKKKTGRPKGSTKYEQRFDNMAYVACAEGGFTVPKIAKLLGFGRSTVNVWMRNYPSFLESINRGREQFDCGIAESCLLKRIKGYKYKEITSKLAKNGDLVVIKVVEKSMAPDVQGIIFFLRNRDRSRWPDIRANENTGEGNEPMVVMLSKEDELL